VKHNDFFHSNEFHQFEKYLEKANTILAEIAEKNENITPIKLADYALFEDFFSREVESTYGNSWIYVTQGTFGIGPELLGYKYYDGQNLCVLSIAPKIEQPETMMLYWIRPMGQKILSVISSLSEDIKKKYRVSSYVKKLFPEQQQFLLKHGFRSAEEFPWHSSAHSEDDTFPELIFDREKTLRSIKDASRSSSLGRIRRGLLKVESENELKVHDFDIEQQAWSVVKEYFLEHQKLGRKINISTPFDYFNMIFHSAQADIVRKVLFLNGKPVGFYLIERRPRLNTANVYCCLALKQDQKYLMDFLKQVIFNEETAKYINCGGSEDAGMDCFKYKYKPIISSRMYMLTNLQ